MAGEDWAVALGGMHRMGLLTTLVMRPRFARWERCLRRTFLQGRYPDPQIRPISGRGLSTGSHPIIVKDITKQERRIP